MNTQTNLFKEEQSVLNYIKNNLGNNSFVEKIKNLVSSDDDFGVPEWQQEIVLDRIKSSKEEDYIAWEEAKKELDI